LGVVRAGLPLIAPSVLKVDHNVQSRRPGRLSQGN
jgi:hypothetical protein